MFTVLLNLVCPVTHKNVLPSIVNTWSTIQYISWLRFILIRHMLQVFFNFNSRFLLLTFTYFTIKINSVKIVFVLNNDNILFLHSYLLICKVRLMLCLWSDWKWSEHSLIHDILLFFFLFWLLWWRLNRNLWIFKWIIAIVLTRWIEFSDLTYFVFISFLFSLNFKFRNFWAFVHYWSQTIQNIRNFNFIFNWSCALFEKCIKYFCTVLVQLYYMSLRFVCFIFSIFWRAHFYFNHLFIFIFLFTFR